MCVRVCFRAVVFSSSPIHFASARNVWIYAGDFGATFANDAESLLFISGGSVYIFQLNVCAPRGQREKEQTPAMNKSIENEEFTSDGTLPSSRDQATTQNGVIV